MGDGPNQRGARKERQRVGEVIGNMFVDDSLWPTRSAGALEEVARMHETFCGFHKVFIHKTKSEYMTVNGKGVQVRWGPNEEARGGEAAAPGPGAEPKEKSASKGNGRGGGGQHELIGGFTRTGGQRQNGRDEAGVQACQEVRERFWAALQEAKERQTWVDKEPRGVEKTGLTKRSRASKSKRPRGDTRDKEEAAATQEGRGKTTTGPEGEDGEHGGRYQDPSGAGHKEERGEDVVPTRIWDRWGNDMMYTRGEEAWQAAWQDLKDTENEDEAKAAGRDTAKGQIAGAPPEEAGIGVERRPPARVKTTHPPEETTPNGPGKRNKLNGPPTGTTLRETATDPDPDPDPDPDHEPDPDLDPDSDSDSDPSDHTHVTRGATHQRGTDPNGSAEGARPNGQGQTHTPGRKRRRNPKVGQQGQHQPGARAGTGVGQWATDRWQCTVCSCEHDPEQEATRMAGQGKRYDGEACSVCATARERAAPGCRGSR